MGCLNKTERDDEPLSIIQILDNTDLNNALWCLRAISGREKEIRLFAVWCARRVQHLLTDEGSLIALNVSEKFANELATKKELEIAHKDAFLLATSYIYANYSAYAAVYAASYSIKHAIDRVASYSASAVAFNNQAVDYDNSLRVVNIEHEKEFRKICYEL